VNGFLKDKQTPKTIFFEKNRNTIIFENIPTDKIEVLFGAIETPYGEFFKLIKNGITEEAFRSDNGIYLLKLYLAIQFWRLPITDQFAETYITNLDLTKFGNRICINGTPIGEVREIKRLLLVDKGFKHYFRSFFLPLLMFDFRVHDEDKVHWRLLTASTEQKGSSLFRMGKPVGKILWS